MRHRVFSWLVFCLSLAITAILWQHEQNIAVRELRNSFDFDLREASTRIEQRVAAYEQMLRGVQGLYATGGHIQAKGFQNYVEALQLGTDFYGVHGLGLVLIVPAKDKERHIKSLRQDEAPGYAITPSGNRNIYAPIVRLEPGTGYNSQLIGYDAYAHSDARSTMDLARDSGNSAISGKFIPDLPTTANQQADFLMFFPLYAQGKAHDSLALRRANISGWVFARLRMKDLMASLYGERTAATDLRIYDGVELNEQNLLYDSGKLHRRSKALLESTEYIEVSGRTWTLVMRSRPALEARFTNNKSSLIAYTGVVLSLLLAVLTWQLTSGRIRAIALATEMTQELRESEERWKYALEGAGDGVWDWDLQHDRLCYSEHLRSLIGFANDAEACSIHDDYQRIHPEDLARVQARLEACLNGKTPAYTCEYRVQGLDGDWQWILARGKVVAHDAEGQPLRMIGTKSDISERKRMEEELRQLSITDTLTGLPNRRHFLNRLEEELARVHRLDDLQVAVMMVDIDHFKRINDQFGHATGDAVLCHFSTLLRDDLRKIDSVGRMGGEEFALLLPGANASAAMVFAERLRSKTAQTPFIHAGQAIPISVSIGVTIIVREDNSANDPLARADKALYQAKDEGRNRVAQV